MTQLSESSGRRGLFSEFFGAIGRAGWRGIDHFGAAGIFFIQSLAMIFRRQQLKSIVQQISFIGAQTMGIIALVALFTGMVIGLQLYYTLIKFGAVSAIGSAIGLSLVRELGPVLTAIMITARAGSAMTAEIGIQRISEQIDALITMRINPLAYLISPRVAAAVISFPLLTALFDLIGIAGGYLSSTIVTGVNTGAYFYRLKASLAWIDVMGGFTKALVFAVLVVTICCYNGFYAHMRKEGRGARGVSLATTAAVVQSCVCILISDYLITSFFL
ncbi:MAG: ABC transporter permease [Desulfobacteraceae bacterium]|nr:ABC transporter permease [Desulfobacteraceae bacterium]